MESTHAPIFHSLRLLGIYSMLEFSMDALIKIMVPSLKWLNLVGEIIIQQCYYEEKKKEELLRGSIQPRPGCPVFSEVIISKAGS